MAEYIDRNKIYEEYEKTQKKGGPWNFEGLIGSIPAADVAPVRHGSWIKKPGQRSSGMYCSKCDCFEDNVRNFCPNCGAKMDGEAQ